MLTLGNEIIIEKRSRYTIWDLLGEVGGFNFGLILVSKLLALIYYSASFNTAFLNTSYHDSNSDARER